MLIEPKRNPEGTVVAYTGVASYPNGQRAFFECETPYLVMMNATVRGFIIDMARAKSILSAPERPVEYLPSVVKGHLVA